MALVLYSAAAGAHARWIAFFIGLIALPLIAYVLWAVVLPSGNGGQACVPSATWSEWSDCSAPCGGGTQFRTRQPATLPSNGGAQCKESDLIQTQACNTNVPCGVPCIPNPHPERYPWSGCPACLVDDTQAAFAWRYVPPAQPAGPYGAQCAVSDVFQTSLCSDLPPCPADVNCVVDTSKVVMSTPCDSLCGPGVQYVWHPITQPASGDGLGCDWNLVVQQVACEGPPCPTPGSCANVEWPTEWGPCSTPCGPGLQFQTRTPTGPDDNCPLVRSQSCQVMPLCTSHNGPDDACCPAGGPGSCNTADWNLLETLCFMSCSGMPAPSPQVLGNYCTPTPGMLAAGCADSGEQGCLQPVDCQLSAWSAWSACSVPQCDADYPDGGMQASSRQVTAWASGGGTPCSLFPLVQTQPCSTLAPVPYLSLSSDGQTFVPATMPATCTPVDCVLSPWAPIGPCSPQCSANGSGMGTQQVARSVTTPASGGGTCPTDPDDYLSISACSGLPTCGECQFMPLEQYLASCTAAGVNPWSTCSSLCDGTQQLQLPIIAPAPPGGWCNISDGIRTQDCCIECQCEDACPIGVNGTPCSGLGTCNSVSNAGSPNGWSYSCDCNTGYSGWACGNKCPDSPVDGSPCGSGVGLGTCGVTTGMCDCAAGISGPACNIGGYCTVRYNFSDSIQSFVMAQVALTNETDASINQASCLAMGGALGGIYGYEVLPSPLTAVVSATASAAPSGSTWSTMDAGTLASVNAGLAKLYGPGGPLASQFAVAPAITPTQAPLLIYNPN